MSNTPLNTDGLDNFMHELGFLWDSYQSVWRNDGRKQYDRDYDDSISMDLAKQLLADSKKHELQTLRYIQRELITSPKEDWLGTLGETIDNLKQELE